MARRREALEHAAPLIRQVARRAALKRRQPRHRFRRMRREQRPNGVERVAGHRAPRPVAQPVELDALGSSSLAPDDGDWIGRQEGIAAEPRALRGAVEKQTIGKGGEQLAATRGVGKRYELLDDRGDARLRHRNGRPDWRREAVRSTAHARTSRRPAA